MRKYVIISKEDVDNIDFSKVLETSKETLRWNNDKTKTFVKYIGDKPTCLEGFTSINLAGMRQELTKSEWNYEE